MESSTFAFGTSCTLTLLSLTGVYGRYGWNHPGPLLYYALTPLSLAAGRAAWATQVGARLLQNVAVAWGGLLALRRRGPRSPSWLS